MRPCSGAIFVLFLAYMLDLYWWGIVATFAMSLGTGLMLSLFAALVRYARNVATRLGHWYGLAGSNQKGEAMIKCIAGAMMIFFCTKLVIWHDGGCNRWGSLIWWIKKRAAFAAHLFENRLFNPSNDFFNWSTRFFGNVSRTITKCCCHRYAPFIWIKETFSG